MNNEKLEKHISEWKFIGEKFKSNANKHYKEINKILTAFKKIKSVLSCIYIEKHLR